MKNPSHPRPNPTPCASSFSPLYSESSGFMLQPSAKQSVITPLTAAVFALNVERCDSTDCCLSLCEATVDVFKHFNQFRMTRFELNGDTDILAQCLPKEFMNFFTFGHITTMYDVYFTSILFYRPIQSGT
ncbi:hypothetical protein XENOCAPTIV_020092 [Xenoophorus captivus]|uniref:Uncharacterized protein n=1 Tax=Xenoophorus captivus TaxID=1517983 RepID=A0ABV0RMN3_9TELE